ncbi:MAG: response regulator, partial [Cyanobacteria bacterium P01_C01_bin.72]
LQTTQMPDILFNLDILLNSASESQKREAYKLLDFYFTRVNQIKPNLREIYILDHSNKIVFSTNKQREGEYEILANMTYIESMEVDANFAPIFYISPIYKKPAITLAKALSNRSGMILVDLDLERIDIIVRERTGLGTSGESYIVGSLGNKNSFIAGKSDNITAANLELDSPAIDAAMAGMNGRGTYHNYLDNPVLGVYHWLNEQDIALLVEITQQEAFSPARKLASAIVVVGLISAVGLLIGVNWLSRQLYFSRQQLKLKAQEAEAANHSKSLFLANMSHELRTPLNAILGFSQLMSRDESITRQQQESLDIINRSGEHLLNLINDVLEMSKIEAGKLVLNNEPLDLHRLLDTIRAMFQVRAQAKDLWFKFSLEDNLPQYVVSDSRKLRQLLINFLSNGIKFTRSGGVEVKVFTCPSVVRASGKAKLCFEVIDTGKGIAEAEIKNLFSPFIQTSSGIKSQEGTGLGLAICNEFVRLMGGEIQVTSIVGEGSVFAFDIVVDLADDSDHELLFPTSKVKQLKAGQADYRIAIVDDRQTNREILVKLLESVGFPTRTANNGKDAIALWQEWQPDLIWMDMRMPVMNGYEATKQIKKLSQSRKTVIIAITASAFEEQREKVLDAGCDDFVAKPFTEQVIFDKLSQHLQVEFIYQNKSEIFKPITNDHKTISQQDLAVLSTSLITEINQAALAVDGEAIERAIAQIPVAQEHIAQAIKEMLIQYDFDGIIDLTDL